MMKTYLLQLWTWDQIWKFFQAFAGECTSICWYMMPSIISEYYLSTGIVEDGRGVLLNCNNLFSHKISRAQAFHRSAMEAYFAVTEEKHAVQCVQLEDVFMSLQWKRLSVRSKIVTATVSRNFVLNRKETENLLIIKRLLLNSSLSLIKVQK
jgi:hypothetical protein